MGIRKGFLLLAFFVVSLLSVPSCTSAVSKQDFDKLNTELNKTKSELSGAQTQLASLQSKLAEAGKVQSQYQELINKNEEVKKQNQELSTKYEELKKQYDTKLNETKVLQTQFAELNTKYEELKKQYSAATGGMAAINEGEVEQALFKVINQERKNNGLDELVWGENLYGWAKANDRKMAETKRVQLSEYPSWQDVFWGVGYSTVDNIVRAAMITWKNDAYRYKLNFLNKGATYGAVGVIKSDEIIYITYIAHFYK